MSKNIKKEISLIAPFFNEEDVISNSIEEFVNVLDSNFDDYEIVLVDDGSSDNSENIVNEFAALNSKINLVKNNTNLGIWKAWKSGVQNAKFECIAVIDSDLQYQPSDLVNLYKHHIDGNQFVQGIRVYSSDVNKVRNLISKMLSILLKIVFKKFMKDLNDVKSGFFVTRKSLMKNIFDFFPDYKYGQTFISIYVKFINSEIKQIPVIFAARQGGKSFLKTLPTTTIIEVILEIFKLKFFLRKKDSYLIYIDFFTKNIKDKITFTFLEKLKLRVYFYTHLLHKWTIGKNLKSYLDAQLKFQYLNKFEILDYQNRKFVDLVWYYYENSKFFKKKLIEADIHPYEILGINDIKKIPILTKDEIKLNFSNDLLSEKFNDFKTLLISTSGSTGNPMNIYANSEQLKVRWANTFRAWTWTGWTPSKKQARLWHQTLGMSKTQIFREFVDNIFFKRKFIPAYSINEKNINKYIDKLVKHKPYLIDGYAESFNFLLGYANINNVDDLKIDAIISSAQEMPENLKKQIEIKFQSKVYDKYGAREFSGIAYEASGNNDHLVNDDSYIVEILKNGKDVDENEIGEIFITDLNNLITPMVRYKIGDLAIKSLANNIQNNSIEFHTLGTIQGRTKAIIVCENNKWVPGTFFAHFFKEYGDYIEQYQVVQNVKDAINLKLIKKDTTTETDVQNIINDLRETVGNIDIEIEYVKDIKMVRTGKIMGAISNLDNNEIFNN